MAATRVTTQDIKDAAITDADVAAANKDGAKATPSLRTLSASAPAAIGTAATGSALTASSSDHVHATGAGTPSTQAFGDAAATGSGPAAAMTDHKHAMPAALTDQRDFVIDGGGATITTGIKGDIRFKYACTITGWTLLADQSGSIVVNIWKDTYANYPPTVADKITASAPPTISAAIKGQSSTLTGWTTAVAAGDTIRINVDSVATIQRVTLSLDIVRT